MLPFIAISMQAAYAAKYGPVGLGPNIVIPDSSMPKWYDHGTGVHTDYLTWTGPSESLLYSTSRGPGATTTPSGLAPSSVKLAYDVPPSGGARAIAIVDAYNYPTALADFNAFSKQYGLTTESSTNANSSTNSHFEVVYQGSSAPANNASWNTEEALDIEWAHAMAPNAKIYLVEANSSGFGDLCSAVQKAASLPNVAEISMSWGGAEFAFETFFDSTFAAKNIVYFASTGDSAGVTEYPSESPNVVAVGGTTLTISGTTVTETPWTGAGGGLSAFESRPSFQSGLSSLVGSHRGASDISAVANPSTGVAIYEAGHWEVVGGTSVACPIVAGITNVGLSFLGSSAAELKKIYSNMGSSLFRSIPVSGSSQKTGGPSWNYITGVGSPQGTTGL